jgi:penicillin amidase
MILLLSLYACGGEVPAGLQADARIVTDASGLRHIQAATERDLFYLQGYITARDRLWQMELLRRRAWGRRAELLGEAYYSSDLQSRALGFGRWGELTAEAIVADPPIHRMLSAYADGVNQLIADVASGAQPEAPQLALLDGPIEPWRVEDTLAIEKLLTAGLSMRPDQDIILGLARTLLGQDLFTDLYQFAPFDRAYTAPDFWPAGASGPPGGTSRDGAARVEALLASLSPAQLQSGIQAARALNMTMGGSNNMAVAAQASETGRALLASDSHQGVGHPSVYYYIHLSTKAVGGDIDAFGATFPGVPMVLFGHNGQVAWAPTTSLYDVADAYLEILDGDTVSFLGEDVPLIEREEVIRVRLADGSFEDRAVTVQEVPHHGPLLPAESLGLPLPLNISIRWTGFQARSVARAFYELEEAQSFDAFRGALDHYYTGGMHWLYADVSGAIGYSSFTSVPVRELLDPAAPPITLLPGDGGYEWLPAEGGPDPFLTLSRDEVPWTQSAPDGFLLSANNDPVGQTDDNDPFNDPAYLSAIFDLGTRVEAPARQLGALIEGGGVSLEELGAVQLNTLSRPAERLLPFLFDAAIRRPDLIDAQLAEALTLLESWDYACDVEAVEPSLFHAWLAVLIRDMLGDEGGGLVGDLLLAELDARLVIVALKMVTHFLEVTEANLDQIQSGALPFPSATGDDYFDDRRTETVETRDELLIQSLRRALDELAPIMASHGADPDDLNTWRWGLWHTMQLVDPADALVPEATSARLPKPGGLYTVDVADYVLARDGALSGSLDVDNAPSNRFLFELDPAGVRGLMALPGGFSEHPGDPHHNDLWPEYINGQYRPAPFAAEEVEASAESVLGWAQGSASPG